MDSEISKQSEEQILQQAPKSLDSSELFPKKNLQIKLDHFVFNTMKACFKGEQVIVMFAYVTHTFFNNIYASAQERSFLFSNAWD